MAADLERSAARARTRGAASAAAAFLDRAAELTPAPVDRAQRLIAAAEAKHEAGAPGATLRLLDDARGQPLTALQEARIARLQTRAEYALKRERGAARRLLAAAQGLDGLDTALARDTYMEALAAAVYGGRLGDADEVAEVSRAILDATAGDESERARDLLLRGQALLFVDGLQAALPTLRHALQAFSEQPPETFELHWMWFASRAAIDVWDSAALRALAERQVELARAAGILTVLPAALSLAMTVAVFDGRLDAAAAACDESDAVQSVTGHPFPQYGRFWLAAYHGRLRRWIAAPSSSARSAVIGVRALRSAPRTSARRSPTTAPAGTPKRWTALAANCRTRTSSRTPRAPCSSWSRRPRAGRAGAGRGGVRAPGEHHAALSGPTRRSRSPPSPRRRSVRTRRCSKRRSSAMNASGCHAHRAWPAAPR